METASPCRLTLFSVGRFFTQLRRVGLSSSISPSALTISPTSFAWPSLVLSQRSYSGIDAFPALLFSGAPIFTPSLIRALRKPGVTVLNGISRSVPFICLAIILATSASGTTPFTFAQRDNVTVRCLSAGRAWLTVPDFHGVSPTASLAFSAL